MLPVSGRNRIEYRKKEKTYVFQNKQVIINNTKERIFIKFIRKEEKIQWALCNYALWGFSHTWQDIHNSAIICPYRINKQNY